MLLVATLIFAFVSAQVAVAGQGGGAETASHKGVHAKASKQQLRDRARGLQQQLQALQAQIAALQAQIAAPAGGGAASPTGAAGGDLTGSYPNPQIAPGVITDADVNPLNVDGAAGTPSLRRLGTTAGTALAGDQAAGGDLTGIFPNPTIAGGAIDAAALGAVVRRDSPLTDAPGGGTTTTVNSPCNAGEQLLGGGVAMTSFADDAFPVQSFPDLVANPDQWTAAVRNGSAVTVQFQVYALCLS